MILEKMLQRLFASLARGPGLNARPHHSRQRLDLCELGTLAGTEPESVLRTLLGPPAKPAEFPACVPAFRRPEFPEAEWSDEQRAARAAGDRQFRTLTKLRDIATDATDYFNDYGENALFLGFPLLSLPPGDARDEIRSNRLLAPVLLAPIHLRVRQGPRMGVTIEPAGDGAEFLIPNPALLAWIEQQTGEDTDDLFADENAEDPWREVAEVVALVGRTAGIAASQIASFGPGSLLQPVPRAENLPDAPTLLASAVLGLFPLTNPGLLRDTKWMIENERALRAPVRSFLTTQAISQPEAPETPAAEERVDNAAPEPPPLPAGPTGQSPSDTPASAHLVTHADPCQSAAVAHARASDALVIHGPPGTGKSQTIANIIGDHLARGQRVLFVCDKRTALDVVKYRLDGMGLGVLCGVIHDPQHDRRHLYLGLRERLEGLADNPPPVDPSQEVSRVRDALAGLLAELRAAFDGLHAVSPASGRSFHDLCGEWLELRARATTPLPDVEGLTRELLDQRRTDADEVLRRAARAEWPHSPYRGRLALTLDAWLATTEAAVRARFVEIQDKARAVDLTLNPCLPSLHATDPLREQAGKMRALAEAMEQLAAHATAAGFITGAARASSMDNMAAHHASIAPTGALLSTPLDPELLLTLGSALTSAADAGRDLLALETWIPLQDSWKRFFARSAKAAASAALARLVLPLSPANVARARTFLQGVRARWTWSDFVSRTTSGTPPAALASDADLVAVRDTVPSLLAVDAAIKAVATPELRTSAREAMANLREQLPALTAALRECAQRAEAIADLEDAWRASGLLLDEALAPWSAALRSGTRALPFAESLVASSPTLDDFVRLEDRRQQLPACLVQALDAAAEAGLLWDGAEPALRAGALAREIRAHLHDTPALARIDTERVEAAFAELQERTLRLHELNRAAIIHRWQTVWRQRLLATTGTRLNSLAASLRQRLFVRGQRALKLRQMIAAGADTPDGDPLFDLCPVWMASPATVAQIFPREPLFDAIVFDEASQCRLEEALPVLLRGRRVVIAGDPKQLPPTRFFEHGVTESETGSVETAEDVFALQQSETEDLLTAALNIDVQEAFLDVHYRSRHEALIGFSNTSFYNGRLQPVPGHPRNKALQTPIRLRRVDGVYEDRGNKAEATAAVDLVAELLGSEHPPSIGIACFNLQQRDLILDALNDRAEADAQFARKLDEARKRRGRDSFEGLFVKNLENVQGDERDHMIISTTFGPAPDGRFRRNFGALSQVGGERRLNVLVTRAREAIHVITSIPRSEYAGGVDTGGAARPNGRHFLYHYMAYAERLQDSFEQWHQRLESARRDEGSRVDVAPSGYPSRVAAALGEWLHGRDHLGSTVHWGNDGFCIDVAITHPQLPEDVTVGVLADFNRYRKTPDPIAWELFRSIVLRAQGWDLHRVWTPALFRDPEAQLTAIARQHAAHLEARSNEDPTLAPPA